MTLQKKLPADILHVLSVGSFLLKAIVNTTGTTGYTSPLDKTPARTVAVKFRHHGLRALGFEACLLVLAGCRLPTKPNCKATILIVRGVYVGVSEYSGFLYRTPLE